MAESNLAEKSTVQFDAESLQELKWILTKSLLDANTQSTQAFEYYLLQTHWPDTSSNLDLVDKSIQQAINEHENIIEQLELAAEAVSELKDNERT